ncbi:hypothetical protein CPAV1605_257 [seawater metagenome]|uniref:Cytochrome c domain-containing protein n=1 Tax=seawater metagenome TaxID=1561972 RepID=A0A5E8CLC8_9ZZZZ
MDINHIIEDLPLSDLNPMEDKYLQKMLNSINNEKRMTQTFWDNSYSKTKLPIVGVIIMLLSKGFGNGRQDDKNIVSSKCSGCHAYIAPNLKELEINNSIGVDKDYKYSKWFNEILSQDSKNTWTIKNLYNFLKNPNSHISGTTMQNPGLSTNNILEVIMELNKKSPKPLTNEEMIHGFNELINDLKKSKEKKSKKEKKEEIEKEITKIEEFINKLENNNDGKQ